MVKISQLRLKYTYSGKENGTKTSGRDKVKNHSEKIRVKMKLKKTYLIQCNKNKTEGKVKKD